MELKSMFGVDDTHERKPITAGMHNLRFFYPTDVAPKHDLKTTPKSTQEDPA